LVTGAGASGCSSGNFASIGGTIGTTAPTYAQLGGQFINGGAYYPINTGTYNAFVFCIKSTQTTQVWFQVSDSATTVTAANSDFPGKFVPVSTAWTSVTVCFDQMQSQSWNATAAGHIFDPSTAMAFSWEITTSGAAYDLEISNFAFAQVGTAACPSLTPTPAPNLALIDDFEGATSTYSDSVSNIFVIQDQAGNWRDGYWYGYSDGTFSFGPGAGYNSATALECQSTQTNDAGFCLTFTNPGPGCSHNCAVTYYNASVGGYTGISFWAKLNSMPAALCENAMPLEVDMVDNSAVTDHYQVLPLTTTWTQFTVYYDHMLSGGVSGTAVNPASISTIKFMPLSLGVTVTTFSCDFLLDDIQFVTGADPNPPTAFSSNMIDDFENGINQSEWNYNGTITKPGYWYTYAGDGGNGTPPPPDPNSSIFSVCPLAGERNGVVFLSTTGYNSYWALHVTGVWGDETYPFIGTGLNLQEPRAQTDLTALNGMTYYAKYGTTNAGVSMYVKFPNGYTDPSGGVCTACSNDHGAGFQWTSNWVQYTVSFKNTGAVNYPVQQQYWGVPGPGSSPPVTIDWQTGTYGGHTFTPESTVYAVQFQTNGSTATNSKGVTYDYWVDNIAFY
jgi:hypothetical protein